LWRTFINCVQVAVGFSTRTVPIITDMHLLPSVGIALLRPWAPTPLPAAKL
jgi:hypothetical protein